MVQVLVVLAENQSVDKASKSAANHGNVGVRILSGGADIAAASDVVPIYEASSSLPTHRCHECRQANPSEVIAVPEAHACHPSALHVGISGWPAGLPRRSGGSWMLGTFIDDASPAQNVSSPAILVDPC